MLGIPPTVNARDTPSVRAAATISPSTARHRKDGSGPLQRTTSRPARPATKSIDGHSMWRVAPIVRWTVGRVCCRSMRSERSMVANSRLEPSCSRTSDTAPAPAMPASIQPESATTSTGSCSFGQPSTSRSAIGTTLGAIT